LFTLLTTRKVLARRVNHCLSYLHMYSVVFGNVLCFVVINLAYCCYTYHYWKTAEVLIIKKKKRQLLIAVLSTYRPKCTFFLHVPTAAKLFSAEW